ncbi:MAG TPA: hypothetical protein VEB59_03005 [Gemmatimonadales bacterium]|nr:hypothetical protein [Gemmatimonadales bacterium]
MIPRSSFLFARQRIVVIGDDTIVNALVISTLRYDGHCATLAAEPASALGDLQLGGCQLVIVGSGIVGAARTELLKELRAHHPSIVLLCLSSHATAGGRQARYRGPVLEEPFTPEQLRAAVRPLLPQLRSGSVLALPVEALRVV